MLLGNITYLPNRTEGARINYHVKSAARTSELTNTFLTVSHMHPDKKTTLEETQKAPIRSQPGAAANGVTMGPKMLYS